MAKKEDKNNDKKEKKEPEVKKKFFKDERVKLIFGVFLLLFSLYLFITLLSFIFTWHQDQSFEWQNVFSSSGIRVSNWGGKLGAFFADLFMSSWFGLPALAIPVIPILWGLRLLHYKPVPFWRTIFKVILGIVLFSIVLAFLFGTANGFVGSGPGGAHGHFIAQWLTALIGKLGTAFLLLLALIAYGIYVNENTLFWIQSFVAWNARSVKSLTAKNPNSDDDALFDEEEITTETVIPKAQEPQKPSKIEVETVFIPQQQPLVKTEQNKFEEDEEEQIQDSITPNSFKFDDIENDFEVTASEVEEEKDQENTSIITIAPESENDIELTIEANQEEEATQKELADLDLFDPTLELSSYQRPPLELLEDYKNQQVPVTNEELVSNKNKIVETLANYKIQIDKIKATIGPTVTLYEIVPAPGVRISKIKNLEDDIALSLAALGIRIIAPIPGKGTIGIEVPNQKPEVVSMYSILKSAKFQDAKNDLAIALGKTISNETYVLDLAKLPHLLVAGATGQGKSVGLNAIITSLVYKKHPSELKFVMIDPKKVELTLYSKLERHFLAKLPDSEEAIITDTQKVIYTLNSLCIEMDARYDLLKAAHVRNLKEYNEKFTSRKLNPNKGHRFLPYIVVVIDEFADLIMTAGREVETPLARLAQLARAIGIHLIIATQRPTTNIITGVIKANFPARIAFRVSSMIDSRTILDSPGANQLIGRGDMLVSSGSDLVRVQCAFVDTPEIERITDYIGNQRGYSTAFMLPEFTPEGSNDDILDVDLKKRDELFEEAARLVVMNQQGSTSLIQRKFSIGYNRAGRIIDQLEAAGIVGPFEGSKARQVLITDELSLEHIFNNISTQS